MFILLRWFARCEAGGRTNDILRVVVYRLKWLVITWFNSANKSISAQSSEAVKHTHCISAEGRSPNEYSVYNTKLSVGEVPNLERWGMQSTPSLALLPDPLWPGVVLPNSVPSMGQIELFDHSTSHWYRIELLVLYSNSGKHLTMCK